MTTSDPTTAELAMTGAPALALDGGAVHELIDVGRQLADLTPLGVTQEKPFVLVRRRQDEVVQVLDLQPQLDSTRLRPRRATGTVELHELDDFVAYVQRLADPLETTVWVDEPAKLFTAVLNDHREDEATLGWRDNRVTYRPRVDPEWAAWKSMHGKMAGQEAFARFIEDHVDYIVEPSGQVVLSVALSFQAHTKVTYSSAVRLDNGATQFIYDEEVSPTSTAANQITVPNQFTLRVEPYTGCGAIDVTTRLRYRINKDDKQLELGVELVAVEQTERTAFDQLRQLLTAQINEEGPRLFPVFAGQAPREGRPGQL